VARDQKNEGAKKEGIEKFFVREKGEKKGLGGRAVRGKTTHPILDRCARGGPVCRGGALVVQEIRGEIRESVETWGGGKVEARESGQGIPSRGGDEKTWGGGTQLEPTWGTF